MRAHLDSLTKMKPYSSILIISISLLFVSCSSQKLNSTGENNAGSSTSPIGPASYSSNSSYPDHNNSSGISDTPSEAISASASSTTRRYIASSPLPPILQGAEGDIIDLNGKVINQQPPNTTITVNSVPTTEGPTASIQPIAPAEAASSAAVAATTPATSLSSWPSSAKMLWENVSDGQNAGTWSPLIQKQRRCESRMSNATRRSTPVVVLIPHWPTPMNIVTTPKYKLGTPASHQEVVTKAQKLPTAPSEIAAFQILETLIANYNLKKIISDDCQVGIFRGYEKRTNGWNWNFLEDFLQQQGSDYSSVLTHLGLKTKVKNINKVDVVCGDDEKRMHLFDFAYSDARSLVKFMEDLNSKEPAELSTQTLVRLKEIFQIPASTEITIADMILRLKQEITSTIDRIETAYRDRAQNMLRKFNQEIYSHNRSQHNGRSATNAGGGSTLAITVHEPQLVEFEKAVITAGLPCIVLEPQGFIPFEKQNLEILKNIVTAK